MECLYEAEAEEFASGCPKCGEEFSHHKMSRDSREIVGDAKVSIDQCEDSPERELDWRWIDREVEPDFFWSAGHHDKKENEERWKEIPAHLKTLARVMIQLACMNAKNGVDVSHGCLFYRCELYDVYRKLLVKGIDIQLPHAWFCDGVMIEPEWIVRITNGIIGWTCDKSVENCGMDQERCLYYGTKKLEDKQ